MVSSWLAITLHSSSAFPFLLCCKAVIVRFSVSPPIWKHVCWILRCAQSWSRAMLSFWTSFRSLKECEALDAMSMGFLSLGLEVLDDIALAQQLSSALLPGCNTTLNQIGTVPERQIEGPPTLNCEYSNFQYIKCKTPYFYSSLIRGPCCLSAFKLVSFCQAVLPRYCCCSTHSMHSWL